ncbi:MULTISPECIES: hypothetical protein [Pseudoalteromonas]|uniref:Uncharacterized protein n=2 Tax=Pseudoalteromonas piscicida TaxID=43662 RepID=A0ABM6NJ92_PSEO7|nr:hypothetical protein [Pseudoalteromonas piscicida]ATD08961.1 hypothetical protein PPIS_a4316 [Pseudoalteromonas piscicida]WPU30938.1 hypothetical protein SIO17_17940 [Pseudoalteromonas piscicida]
MSRLNGSDLAVAATLRRDKRFKLSRSSDFMSRQNGSNSDIAALCHHQGPKIKLQIKKQQK